VAPAVWVGAGLDEGEFERVMGCDSAAGTDGTLTSAGLVESLVGDGDRWLPDEASPECCGSGGGESAPFAYGPEACAEPDALERRERSLAILRILTVGIYQRIPAVRMVWKRFPQDCRARSAEVRGYRAMDAGLNPSEEREEGRSNELLGSKA
jgi:hypothetical protein